jgi:predicted AAA+ superfamily ATPase
MADLDKLIKRAEQVLERFEATLPRKPEPPDWKASVAFRWR